jgi:hypothetical protein
MPAINLSPLTAEQESLDRRRKMAEALQQQAILPIEMPNVPGAKVSHLQGFAKLLQGYIAGKNLERAEEEKKQYEADTMGDFAKILRNTGKYQTIPGTPAVPEQTTDVIEPNIANQNLQAVAARQMTRDPNAPISPFEKQIGEDERAQISQLPLESTRTMVTPAVVGTPDRQVPFLSPELLSDPNFMKTSSGRMMLAQALMQQQAQQQAEALRRQEAEQAIVKFGPEDTAGRIVNGVFKPIVQGVKQPKWEKSSQFDANGQEITGWVNTNAPDIPASFVPGATKPLMTASQQLDADAKIFAAEVEAQKAIDQGRVPLTFKPTIRGVKPLPPQGTKLETGVVYDTPRGRARWDGSKFTSVD